LFGRAVVRYLWSGGTGMVNVDEVTEQQINKYVSGRILVRLRCDFIVVNVKR
ncbi:unnamed protein product, partial [Tenebrio molitor]